MLDNADTTRPVTPPATEPFPEPAPPPVLRRPPHVEWGDIEQGLIPPGHPIVAAPVAQPWPAEAPRRHTRHLVRDVVETLLLALIIYMGVRAGVQNFKVDGNSMEPSLSTNQYLLVNKLAYASVSLGGIAEAIPALEKLKDSPVLQLGTPQRGDIIVFRFPRDPSRDFIKRVVAVPGEKVEVKTGVVYVNDKRLEEPYILNSPTYTKEAIIVPAGEYFVLGDNRNNSSDSHVWGPVPGREIVGKAWITYWPMEAWGFIPHTIAAAH